MKRLHLLISGQVQGVFFRKNTKKLADELGVTGWVRNTDDKVEVVAEGGEEDIKQLVEFCGKGPTGADVKDVSVSEENYAGEFEGFEVRY